MRQATVNGGSPGRACPISYRYGAAELRRPPEFGADTLLIAGGLYGNPHALDALLELACQERGDTKVVFNGDFHWFDIDPAVFAAVNRAVLSHTAIRGNVETEVASPAEGAGCGCGYPEWVGDGDVDRSNRIIRQLAQTAEAVPGATTELAHLPMTRVAEVGGERIGIVHGDGDSLAGWDCSVETLRDHPQRAASQLATAQVRVLATSHTCLPAMASFELAQGPALIANNGAAGMPNFRGTQHGIATRISIHPAPRSLYGTRLGALHIDAVAIEYDAAAFLATFDRQWPAGSPAEVSYRRRITEGPRFALAQATARPW